MWFAGIAVATSLLALGWAVEQVRIENAREERFLRLREVSEGIQRREVDAMSTMARDLAALVPGPGAPEDSVRGFLSRMEGQMRIARADLCFVLDSTGKVRLRRQDQKERDILGRDLSFRRYFQEARQGREDLLGALGAYTGRRGIYASAPVMRGGRPCGVVVTRLRADEIERTWLESQTDPVAVISPEGVVLASNVQEWNLGHVSSSDWPLERALGTGQFGKELRPLGVDLLGTATRWKGREWRVLRADLPGGWTVAGLVRRSARSPLTPSQKGVILGVFLAWTLLVLLGAAVFLVLRRIGRVERERGDLVRRLDEAERLESLGRLAGGIAHDFNNVLTAIIGYSSVLELKLAGRPGEQEMARRTELAARRASDTVKQLMAFARRSGLESRPVSVHELVRELEGLVEHTFPRGVRVETRLVAPQDVVVGDPTQLHQALLNLAVNARDAMPDGGVLRFVSALSPAPGARMLELRVSDSGPGIPPEVLPHVFEPFFTTKSGGRGTGLGLASVWGTIRRHGGSIEVRLPESGGTEFIMTLPLASHGAGPSAGASHRQETAGRGKLRIAALDDDIHVLEALETMCRTLGHEVAIHTNHLSLVSGIRRAGAPDLLILDLEMPGLSGTQALRNLRREHPDLRVLVASGQSSTAAAEEIRRLGVRVFLPKPFGAEDLARAIEEVLRDPEA